MKTYYYKRADGLLIRIEAEQMFWSGSACVFVKGGLAAAVISLLPGEVVAEQGVTDGRPEVEQEATQGPVGGFKGKAN